MRNGISGECRAVSNYIIEKSILLNKDKPLREQVLMSTKRLQKLLYFCDIEYMKLMEGIPLFSDDFYVWPSGLVIPNVYREFMQYQDGEMFPCYEGETVSLSEMQKQLIDAIIDYTKELDTVDLIRLSVMDRVEIPKDYESFRAEKAELISKRNLYDYYKDKNLFNLNLVYQDSSKLLIKE